MLEASEVDGPNGLPDQPYAPKPNSSSRPTTRALHEEPRAYPFLDVGGHFVEVGPAFASALLQGLTIREIAADLATRRTPR